MDLLWIITVNVRITLFNPGIYYGVLLELAYPTEYRTERGRLIKNLRPTWVIRYLEVRRLFDEDIVYFQLLISEHLSHDRLKIYFRKSVNKIRNDRQIPHSLY
jgi:hypothetical protein